MKWKILLEQFTRANPYMKLNPPAIEQEICEIEEKLQIIIPEDLKGLLREINGDDFLLFSAKQIVETNLEMRTQKCFMPLDCLLFFGTDGSGNYYGFPITCEDGVRDDNVYMWDHEYDSREWKAGSLEQMIIKYYTEVT